MHLPLLVTVCYNSLKNEQQKFHRRDKKVKDRKCYSVLKESKFSTEITSKIHFCDLVQPTSVLNRTHVSPLMIYYTPAELLSEYWCNGKLASFLKIIHRHMLCIFIAHLSNLSYSLANYRYSINNCICFKCLIAGAAAGRTFFFRKHVSIS